MGCSRLTTYRYLFLIFFSAFLLVQGYSSDYSYINYTVDDGLPSSQLYNVLQDRNGNLWFSSDNGVVKYNGYEFEVFDVSDGLPENVILRLYPQSNGDIWGATLSGKLFYFNDNEKVFHTYKFNDSILPWWHNNFVSSLYIASDKSIYLSQSVLGYTKIDSLGNTTYKVDLNSEIQQNTDSIYLVGVREVGAIDANALTFRTLTLDGIMEGFSGFLVESKRIKVGRSSYPHIGISWPYQQCPTFSSFNLKIDVQTGGQMVFNDKIISHGSFGKIGSWVAVNNEGVRVYSEEGELVDWFLDGYDVTDVQFDHANGIWITTLNSGIFYIKNYHIRQLQIPQEHATGISRLAKIDSATLGITYGASNKVYPLNGFGLLYRSTASSEGTLYSTVHDKLFLKPFRSSYLFIGADSIQLDHTYSLRSIQEDNYSNEVYLLYYIGYFEVLDTELNRQSFVFRKRIYSVCNNGQGGWYVGTSDGLFNFRNENSFEDLGVKEPLFNRPVSTICRTPGFFLLASKEVGIIIFNRDTLFSVDKSRGLASNRLLKVYKESDTVFWACSNSGLSRLSINRFNEVSISNFTTDNGLPSNEVIDVIVENGLVWVATAAGVCNFRNTWSVSDVVREDFLRIKNVFVNERSFTPAELSREFNYFENNVKFHFEAISYLKEGNVLYRYRIEGLETKWNYTNTRESNYQALPPGRFTFVVEADIEGNGIYGNSVRVPFSITPPYYSTWWFKMIIAFIVGMAIYLFFKMRILQYNRDIVRALLMHVLRLLKPHQNKIVIKDKGQTVQIATVDITYIQSDGNYIDIHTENRKFSCRAKIGEFMENIPDSLEFLRIHRSFIVRLDKIQKYDKKTVTLLSGEVIPIGSSYRSINIEVSL